jgi:hypothetical protein
MVIGGEGGEIEALVGPGDICGCVSLQGMVDYLRDVEVSDWSNKKSIRSCNRQYENGNWIR